MTKLKLQTIPKYKGCPEELEKELKAGYAIYGEGTDYVDDSRTKGHLIEFCSWNPFPYKLFCSTGNIINFKNFHPINKQKTPTITIPITYRPIDTFNPRDYEDIEEREFMVYTNNKLQYLAIWLAEEEIFIAHDSNEIYDITHYAPMLSQNTMQNLFASPSTNSIIDWENMPINTPFLIKDILPMDNLRYYAYYDTQNKKPLFWIDGKQSHEVKVDSETSVSSWEYYQQIIIPGGVLNEKA